MTKLNPNEQYFLHLLTCALKEKAPLPVPAEVCAEEVGKIAVRHHLLHTIYEKAEEAGCLPEGNAANLWKDEYIRNKVRDLRQQIAFDEIADILDANGIRFLPLKGLSLKPLYPQSYFRRMIDLDILIEKEKTDLAVSTLSKNGFVPDIKNQKHYNMKKPPSVYVELHRFLFWEEKYQVVFSDVWSNAKNDGVHKNGFQMAAEDLACHTIIHYANHFREGGVGIRAVMDFYILRKAFPAILNSKELNSRLKAIGVLSFYEVLAKIGDIWFEQKTFEDSYEDIQQYLFHSGGTYGNVKTTAINRSKLANGRHFARILFFLRTLFPPYREAMCILYPRLKKAPFLLPLCWILRIFRIVKQGDMFRKIKIYRNVKHSDSEKWEALAKRFGFPSAFEDTVK